jgi:hypothetical protein
MFQERVLSRRTVLIAALAVVIVPGCFDWFGEAYDPTDTGFLTAFDAIQIDPPDESSAGPFCVVPVDLNGDGEMDLVSGWNESQPVQIHINQGGAHFHTHTIAGAAPITKVADVDTADFDQDGNPDIGMLVQNTGFIPPQGADVLSVIVLLFAPDDPEDIDGWTEITLDSSWAAGQGDEIDGYADFAIGDVDGVNGPDMVVTLNLFPAEDDPFGFTEPVKEVLWFRNPGPALARVGSAWQWFLIHFDVPDVNAVLLTDLDNDTDPDVIVSYPQSASLNIRWLRNPRVPMGAAAAEDYNNWEYRPVGQQMDGGDMLDLGDIDDDGDLDVLAMSRDSLTVQWFANPGQPHMQAFPWQVFTIADFVNDAEGTPESAKLGFINGDDRMDCAVSISGKLRWYSPRGSVFSMWDMNVVADSDPLATIGKMQVMDLNGDGRGDILAPFDRAGLANDQLWWFRNRPPGPGDFLPLGL